MSREAIHYCGFKVRTLSACGNGADSSDMAPSMLIPNYEFELQAGKEDTEVVKSPLLIDRPKEVLADAP